MGRTKQTKRKHKGTDGDTVASKKVAKASERSWSTTEKPPPSRYSELPTKYGEPVLEAIRQFLKNRVTDKWLCFEKQKLMKIHPGNSPESIDELLLSTLSAKEKYNGKDVKQLISILRDPTMIESTAVSGYMTVGIINIAEYIKKGGSYHCILCGKAALYNDAICQESVADVPVFLITGLMGVLFPFTELKEEKFWGTIAFKKVKNNPFDELVKIIAELIPDEFSPAILKWKQGIDCTSINSEDGKMDVSSNGEEVLENIKNNGDLFTKEKEDNGDLFTKEKEDNGDLFTKVGEEKEGIHVPDTSDPSALHFTQRIPQIQVHDQQMILKEIESAFSKFPNAWLLHRKKMLKNNPKLTPEDIENILYKTLLFREDFVGEDIVDMISFVPTDTDEYFAASLDRIYDHVKGGGLLHFILYCDSAADFINKNDEFQSFVANIPLCSVQRLSTVVNKLLFSPRSQHINAIIGFKKAKGNPFQDLVKFIGEKMPDKYTSQIKVLLDESAESIDKNNDVLV